MPEERLQKVLARAGIASRRASEELIKAGRICVDGIVAELGNRVDPEVATVTLDGHRIPLNPTLRYLALHKPVDVLTTMHDDRGRPDLRTLLPTEPRLFPIGRLDQATEGLLLVTNDGDLAEHVTHPRYGVEKEYLAEVQGEATPKHLARLRSGVDLDDGPAFARRAVSEGTTGDRGAVRLVMTEGRKREVRRLLDAVGLPVVRLVRVRVGPVRLGDLVAGTWRDLELAEVRALFEAAGL